jgi:hypothetical protein
LVTADIGMMRYIRRNLVCPEGYSVSKAAPTDLQLLSEIEDLLRTRPAESTMRESTDEILGWLGRMSAVISQMGPGREPFLNMSIDKVNDPINGFRQTTGYREIMVALNKARHELIMRTVGPTNVAVPHGAVFDYFDEIRKAIEAATQEIFFVDPYLEADFVSRYFPHIHVGVQVRLLTSNKKLSALLPAVEMFAKQSGLSVAVRLANVLHDRYLFIDKATCYQSGASFKDGGKYAPTTLTQITDAFDAMWNTYDGIWNSAKVER